MIPGATNTDIRTKTLAIIAGRGDLPKRIADACRVRGEPFIVLAFEGETEADWLHDTNHYFIRLGHVGEAMELMHRNDVQQIVMAGPIARPRLRDLKPDAKGAQLLKKLGKSLFAGDDRLLSTITRFMEAEGFKVVGADTLLESGTMEEGPLGSHAPDEQALEDIRLGLKTVKAIGALDIGQGVIVQHGHVLGVEAVEGTDALIARCATLKQEEAGGVLVKAAKPGQEERVDMPAIGVETVKHMVEAGFAGIALEAGHTLIIDREAVIEEADKGGLFVVGVSA